MGDGQVLEQFFCPFVHIKHPQLQVEDWFARYAEKKVSRLDNARVDRSHGHLKNTLAFHLTKFMPWPVELRKFRAQIEILAQRIDLRPIVVQRTAARVRMANEFEAE